MYFNTKLRVLEKRQQQIRDLSAKHKTLKEELEDTKSRLMMDPSKWIGECKYYIFIHVIYFLLTEVKVHAKCFQSIYL